MAADTNIRDLKPHAYNPEEALALFYYLCDEYRKGSFSFREFNGTLNSLRFIDINKDIWTIGAKSGDWYRLKGKSWVKGYPYGLLATVDEMLWYEHINKIELPPKKLCKKCGAELIEDSRFCSKCAAPVTTEIKTEQSPIKQKIFCRKCGNTLKPDSKFCTKCGTPRR